MLVKMKSCQKGSDDGFTIRTFEKGETYEVSEALGKVMLEEKWATEVKDDSKSNN